MSDSSEDLAKALASNPGLADLLKALASNPALANQLSMAGGRPKQEQGPTVDKLFQSVSVCVICGKEQKVFTIKKPMITQCTCSSCQNQLNNMLPKEQDVLIKEALQRNHFGAAEAKFKAQQNYFKKLQKKAEQEKKDIGFSTIVKETSDDETEG